MKRLPKSIYVVSKSEGQEDFLIASDNMADLGIDVGDKVKIGLYKFEGFYNAEGVIETGKIQKR